MNSYGVNAQASVGQVAEGRERGVEIFAPSRARASTKPEISAGHPSLYDTYAREQSPCDPITNYAERRGI